MQVTDRMSEFYTKGGKGVRSIFFLSREVAESGGKA